MPPRPKNAVERKYERLRASTILRLCFIPSKNIISPVCRHLSKLVLKSLRTPQILTLTGIQRLRSIIIPFRPKNAVKRKYERLRASTIFRLCFIPSKNIISPVCRHLSKLILKSLRTPLKCPRFDGKGVRSIIIPLSPKNAVESVLRQSTAMGIFLYR